MLTESDITWDIPGAGTYDRIDELHEYLENFPDGSVAEPARRELERLEKMTSTRYF